MEPAHLCPHEREARIRLSVRRKLCGQDARSKVSMFEVPDAGEDHRDLVFIRSGDYFFVTY